MELGRHTGETTQDLTPYTGNHRAFQMDSGIALFPLGDRNRGRIDLGEGSAIYEERYNDKLDKYLKKF
jgi:hypothetical protein